MDVIVKSDPPSSVDWKGVKYLPGSVITDMPEKEAKRLIDKGKVERAEEEETPEPVISEEVIEAARKAIEAGQTTGSGKPKVEAMAEILGRDVSAAERDEAFEKLNA